MTSFTKTKLGEIICFSQSVAEGGKYAKFQCVEKTMPR